MLSNGSLQKRLLAQRNKVHIRNPTPRNANSDSSSGPSFGNNEEEEEDAAVEIEAIDVALLDGPHEDKHNTDFFAN